MPEYSGEENYLDVKPFRYLYRTWNFTFGMCALDYRKNFVHMRKDKDYKYIKCQDEQSITDFCNYLIGRSPRQNVAVFVINLNGDITIFLHNDMMEDEETDRFRLQPKVGINKDFYVLGDLAEDMGLECYGLLAEVEHDIFQVIER